jgi:hypothetical protein
MLIRFLLKRIVYMGLFLVAASLLLNLLSPSMKDDRNYPAPPTINLNAIHLIICTTPDGDSYSGTGWLIAKDTVATANHIATAGICKDINADTILTTYKTDARHDFALMTGKEPSDEPYIKYTCARPQPRHIYTAYGITSYGYEWGHELFRDNVLTATDNILKRDDAVDDFDNSKGMREYLGVTAPGMSGGPVISPETGYAYALVNAGDDKSTLLFDLADTILCH